MVTMKARLRSVLNPSLLVALLAIYPALFIWQGLDMTDMGFTLVQAQQFFPNPEAVSYQSFDWLTNLLGALWLAAFGRLGAVSFRIGYLLVLYLLLYLSYQALKPFAGKANILGCLFLTLAFSVKKYGTWVNNYWFTSLFLLLAGLLLFKGLRAGKRAPVVLSGAVAGLGFYVRLPNILILSLVFCIAY